MRVTIATTPRWLHLALPAGMYSSTNPSAYNGEAQKSRIAQLFYRDGIGLLRMKFGPRVLTRQLAGAGEALTLRFGGASATLSSFSVAGNASWMNFYLVAAGSLPQSGEWPALYRELTRLAGIRPHQRRDSPRQRIWRGRRSEVRCISASVPCCIYRGA